MYQFEIWELSGLSKASFFQVSNHVCSLIVVFKVMLSYFDNVISINHMSLSPVSQLRKGRPALQVWLW